MDDQTQYHHSPQGTQESPAAESDLDGAKDQERPQDDLTLARTNSAALSLSPIAEWLFVAVICLAQFWTQFALGQVLGIVHVIGDTFEVKDSGTLSWLIAGYSLTVGTFILVSGRFGDVFGYKRMLLIGYSWFALWSLVAGVAAYSNSVLFIFARVLQGIGPSMALPNGLAILGHVYPPGPRKNMCFSLFAACAPGGCVAGLAFGGLFALAWWPWVFFFLSIALTVTTVVAFFVVPDHFQKLPPKKSLRGTLGELDVFGSLLGVVGLITFNFAWNQAPVTGWQEAYIIVCFILGLVITGVFFWYEGRYASNPLIPVAQLTADVAWVLGCMACGWSCFGIWIYYTLQFLEQIRGASPLLTAAWASPMAISGAVAAVTTGKVLGRLQPAAVMLIALTAFTIGTTLVATAPVDQIYWGQAFVTMLIITWGMDMSFPAATLILSNSLPKNMQGIAASLVNTVVNYSISIGLGMAATLEIHVNNGGSSKSDLLKGYRGALYLGIGLAGLGICISVLFVLKSSWQGRH